MEEAVEEAIKNRNQVEMEAMEVCNQVDETLEHRLREVDWWWGSASGWNGLSY